MSSFRYISAAVAIIFHMRARPTVFLRQFFLPILVFCYFFEVLSALSIWHWANFGCWKNSSSFERYLGVGNEEILLLYTLLYAFILEFDLHFTCISYPPFLELFLRNRLTFCYYALYSFLNSLFSTEPGCFCLIDVVVFQDYLVFWGSFVFSMASMCLF